MTHPVRSSLTLTLSLLWLAGASSAGAETWNRSFSVGRSPSLRVHTGDADVEVSAWSKPEIQIDVDTRGHRVGSGGLSITAEQSGDEVTFELRDRTLNIVWWGFSNWGGHSPIVHVRVPASTALDIRGADGSVAVNGVAAHVQIGTSDGSVTLRQVRGDVQLHSSDGSIDAQDVDGSLSASSSDGSIHVAGRFDGLDLSSDDGSIIADARGGSRLASPWSLTASDGSVRLHVPRDLDATVDAHTSDGAITLDLPLRTSGRFSDHAVHGDLNRGGPELRLHTADGSIVLGASEGH